MAPRLGRVVRAVVAIALSFGLGCSKSSAPSSAPTDTAPKPDTASGVDPDLPTLKVTTTSFPAGGAIPAKYSCDGGDVSPALTWSGAPTPTKGFIVVADDPDAPGGTFTHWILYDIPASTNTLAEGSTGVGTAGKNGFDVAGYRGPCPPKGKGLHHYSFRVYAVDVGTIGLLDEASRADLDAVLPDHVVAQGALVGTFEH